MSSKECFKCGKVKPLDEFYRHPRMGDGRLNKCKECTKSDVIKNRLANIEYYREYDRGRANLPHRVSAREEYSTTDAYKESHRKSTINWRNKNPDRRKAQTIFGNAVRDGKIQPLPCFICGRKAEGHHPDYSRPLDVVWLCRKHHSDAHKLTKLIHA